MADDRIRSALEGPLARQSLVLDDLTITPAGKRRVVRVIVDRALDALAADDTTSPVPPLSLDEVADATRTVSDVLDGTHDDAVVGEDLMGSAPYTLEVSSPGLDRSLSGHRAFRRNVGRLVALVLESGETLTARILSVTDGPAGAVAEVEVPAQKKRAASTREVRLDEVTSAKVQVEFRHHGAADPVGDTEVDDTEVDETDDTAHDTAHDDED